MKSIFNFRRNHDVFYGWWLAIAGAGVMALGTVPMFQGLPLWNPVLRNSFAWTASQMSWAFAVKDDMAASERFFDDTTASLAPTDVEFGL